MNRKTVKWIALVLAAAMLLALLPVSTFAQGIAGDGAARTRTVALADTKTPEEIAAEEEAAKKLAEEEAAKKLAEEEAAKKLAEEEAAKKLAEEEAAKKLAEEKAAKKLAEEEAAKKLAEEEAAKKLAEEEAAKKLAEEEAADGPAAITHTVTFYEEDGTTLIASETVEDGGTLTSVPDAPPKADCAFAGWVTSGGGRFDTGMAIGGNYSVRATYNTTAIYTLTIYYRYGADAENTIAADTVVETLPAGTAYSKTSPAIKGYTPDQDVVGGTLNDNATFTVTYTVAEGTPYTVQHFWQNTGDDAYTLHETETPNATTGATVTVEPKDYRGFTSAHGARQARVAADGSTVVEMYYDRVYTAVYFDSLGGGYVDPVVARFGASVTAPADPAKPGYTFAGWQKDGAGFSFAGFTMPAESLTLAAKWTAAEASYAVCYWLENADDDGYAYQRTVMKTGATDTAILADVADAPAELRDTAKYAYDHYDEGKTVAGDNSTVVNVYYKRAVHTLTFRAPISWDKRGNATAYGDVGTIVAKYDAPISGRFPIAGYEGRAWEESGFNPYYKYALQTLDRMPDRDVTFQLYDKSSELLKTIHYYGTSIDGTGWVELKSVTTYFNYITYEEEYHTIDGFTRWSAAKAGFDKNNRKNDARPWTWTDVSLYYERNSYALEYYYNTSLLKKEAVPYQKPLSGYGAYTPARPAGVPENYVFAGWYQSTSCQAGTEADWSGDMPIGNIKVYAKWAAPRYTVTFDADGGAPVPASQPVDKEGFATKPADPARDGYTFLGWYNGGVPFFFDTKITKDITLTAAWQAKTDAAYTVHYYKEGTTEPLFPDETVTGVTVASTVTVPARCASGESDEAWRWIPDATSKSLTIAASGNELVFYYAEFTSMPYTVHYYRLNTTEQVAGDKTGVWEAAKGSRVTESAAQVDGYTPTRYEITQALQKEGANVIIFYYVANDQGTYRVEHYYQGLDGKYPAAPSETDAEAAVPIGTVLYGRSFAKDVPGLSYNDRYSTQKVVVGSGSAKALKLYYTRNSYTVTYQVDGAPYGAGETYLYEESVTVKAEPMRDGHAFGGWTASPGGGVTGGGSFAMPASDVVIIGMFTANRHTVTYRKGDHGTLDGTRPDAVSTEAGYGDATPAAPGVTPEDGWAFLRFEDDDGNLPSATVVGDAVYTAVYRRVDYAYTVRYTVDGGEVDAWRYTDTAHLGDVITSFADHRPTGYKPAEGNPSLTITESAGQNVIWIAYVKDSFTYSVKYFVDGVLQTGAGWSYTKLAVFGTVLAETDISTANCPDGYRVGEKRNLPLTVSEDAGQNIIEIYYIPRTDYAYTVRYLDAVDQATVLAPAVNRTGRTFLETYTETPVEITGYEPLLATQQIKVDAADKELVFYYTPKEYTLTYLVDYADGNGYVPYKAVPYKYLEAVTAEAVPAQAGKSFSAWSPAIPEAMPAGDLTVRSSAGRNQYVLTIRYQYADKTQAAPVYTANIAFEGGYDVPSPAVTGCTADRLTVSGAMPAHDVEVIVTYAVNSYSLTIHYQYADGTAAAKDYTHRLDYREPYAVDSPAVTGYTARTAAVSGVMPAHDVEVTVPYDVNSHDLTITYVMEDGTAAPGAYRATLRYQADYDVTSPVLTGYTADRTEVKGAMPDADVRVLVTYRIHTWTLTVNYVYDADGAKIDPSDFAAQTPAAVNPYKETVSYNGAYEVTSPARPGYTADLAAVSGLMPDEDVTREVRYSARSYQLVIRYRYENGTPVTFPDPAANPNPYQAALEYGVDYSVPSPGLPGYTPDVDRVAGKMEDGDAAFIVTYTANRHDVTYVFSGKAPAGAVLPGKQTGVSCNDYVTVAAVADVTGYTFSGWATADAAIRDGKFRMPDQDVTLTGGWSVNTHPVIYAYTGAVPEGASLAPAAADSDYGAAVRVAAGPARIPAGYVFSGWTTADAAVSEGAFSMPDRAVRFTGAFIPRAYTVSYEVAMPAGVAAPAVPAPEKHAYTSTVTVRPGLGLVGYIFSGWTVKSPATVTLTGGAFTMPHENVVLRGSFTRSVHTLTVVYRYADTGAQAAPTVAHSVGYGGAFSVASPVIAGYTASETVIGGVMGNADLTFIVEYTPAAEAYTLVIAYLYADTGAQAADTYRRTAIPEGTGYSVASPAIPGYTASIPVAAGVMPARNLKIDVYYHAAAPVAPPPGGPGGTGGTIVPGGAGEGTAAAPLEVIGDDAAALAGRNHAWALLNLILAIATALTSLLMLLGYIGKKKEERELNDGTVREEAVKKHGWMRLLTLLPAIGGVVVFILTENMRLPMQWTDRYTLLMAVIALIQLCLALLAAKERAEQDPEDAAGPDKPGAGTV